LNCGRLLDSRRICLLKKPLFWLENEENVLGL
jgi:hypothetical protein